MKELSDNSLFILKNCLKKRKPAWLATVETINKVKHEMKFYNELRQIVGDELIEEGFNGDYQPNEYGLKLEKLIDELGKNLC